MTKQNKDSDSKKKIGSPTGPRPVFWVGLTSVDGRYIMRRVSSEDSGVKSNEFHEAVARDLFHKKYASYPTAMDGPFRSANLPQTKNSGKKAVFDQTTMIFTGEKRNVSYKGWKGIAHLVKDGKNNEAAVFLFESELNPEKGRSKAKPKAKIVPISMLK